MEPVRLLFEWTPISEKPKAGILLTDLLLWLLYTWLLVLDAVSAFIL